MITALLIIHGVIAVFLIGGISHQALGVFWPRRPGQASFVAHARGVRPQVYANAIVILYVVTFCLGAYLYPVYRVDLRPSLEELQLKYAIGLFEVKENFAAIGLAMLPAYWYYWTRTDAYPTTRKILAALLFGIVWFNFIVGHILNNIRGFA